MGLPWWLMGKEFTCKAGDTGDIGSMPGLGRYPEEKNGDPLQCSFLNNPMDRGAWQVIAPEDAKNWTQLRE